MNDSEVRKFLDMSPAERTARRAAHELFNSLCNGNEYVTVEQLEYRMREIYNIQKRDRNQSKSESCKEARGSIRINDQLNGKIPSMRTCSNESHIYESNLLAAAHNYSHGVIPAINQSLSLSMPNSQALQKIPIFHQPFFHPILFLSVLYHRLVSVFSTAPLEILKSYKILILFLAHILITSPDLKVSMSTFAYYVSLFTMIFATFNMLRSKHQFIEFKIWSGLFLSFNENVYAEDSENLYMRKSMIPYLWFFFAFIINMMLFPFIENDWRFASEIATVSLIFFLGTFVCFMFTSSHNPDFVVVLSIFLNIFAKYPHKNLKASTIDWTFIDWKIPLIGYIDISLNLRAILYVGISFCMLILARRNAWQGIYQHFFPHAVTLTWLQIFLNNLHSATTFGLIRSSVVITAILFFLPIVGLATLLIPTFLIIEWLSITDFTNRILITFFTSVIAITGSVLLAFSNRARKYVTSMQIILSIFTILFLLRPIIMEKKDNTYSSYLHQSADSNKLNDNDIIDLSENSAKLTWELYYKYCIQSDIENINLIDLQTRCYNHLEGSSVYWSAVVTKTRISNIKNWRKTLIDNYAPSVLRTKIVCLFGEKSSAKCVKNEECKKIKEFINEQKTCNLEKWNM
jgi:wolfamin